MSIANVNTSEPQVDLTAGLDIDTTEGALEFIARLFNQRIDRRDFAPYIANGLAGDFAYQLARYLAPLLSKVDQQLGGVRMVPFRVGNYYQTLEGKQVRFVRVHREGTPYETMEDESGTHRYTQRDFGRVTGTDHHTPDPRNVQPLYHLEKAVTEEPAQHYPDLEQGHAEIASLKLQLAEAKASGYEISAKALRDHQDAKIIGGRGGKALEMHAANYLDTLAAKLRGDACSGAVAPSAQGAAAVVQPAHATTA